MKRVIVLMIIFTGTQVWGACDTENIIRQVIDAKKKDKDKLPKDTIKLLDK